ncbi:uncharacterized protein [Henckelia pumila]|uniref:uncharacterized protein isoform X1 n=1 Tax=Henckelia pumila TaxID=405737 RepID=UPI003C6E4568
MARRICDVEKFEFTAIGENHNQGYLKACLRGYGTKLYLLMSCSVLPMTPIHKLMLFFKSCKHVKCHLYIFKQTNSLQLTKILLMHMAYSESSKWIYNSKSWSDHRLRFISKGSSLGVISKESSWAKCMETWRYHRYCCTNWRNLDGYYWSMKIQIKGKDIVAAFMKAWDANMC